MRLGWVWNSQWKSLSLALMLRIGGGGWWAMAILERPTGAARVAAGCRALVAGGLLEGGGFARPLQPSILNTLTSRTASRGARRSTVPTV